MARDLTTGSPMRLIWSFALPTLFGMLFQQFYNMMDTMIVGQLLGASALASVGSTSSINFFVIGFCMGVCNGFAIPVAQRMGAGDYSQMRRCVANAGWLSALFAVVLTVFTGLFCRTILTVMRTPEDIFDGAYWYILIIFLGIPTTFLYNLLAAVIRALGDSKTPVYFLAISSVLNIALDPLLIFVFDMGVAGAAWATIFSQFVSFCLLLVGCTRGGNLQIHVSRVQLKWDYFSMIIRGGLPSLARQGLASFATICLNWAIRPYGDAAIAAMGVVQRIAMFGGSAMIGFGQGFQPVCGFNYGAQLYSRVREGFWFCVKSSTVFLLVVSTLGFAFAPQLIALFRDDPEVVAIGAVALRCQCVTFCAMGWVTMSNMMLQTIGQTVPATFLAMARQGIFFVPLVWILPLFLGLTGVQITQSASDLLTLACAIPIQLSALRKLSLPDHTKG